MTTVRRQPERKPRVLSSHEAALVGALTAFAKSTSSGPPSSGADVSSRGGARSAALMAVPGPLQRTQSRQSVKERAHPPLEPKPARRDAATTQLEQFSDAAKEPGRRTASLAQQRLASQGGGNTQVPPASLDGQAGEPPQATLVAAAGNVPPPGNPGPSTSALVNLFEQHGTSTAGIPSDTPISSPKPTRKSSVLTQDDRVLMSQLPPPPMSTLSSLATGTEDPVMDDSDAMSTDSLGTASNPLSPIRNRKTVHQNQRPAQPPRTQSQEPKPLRNTPPKPASSNVRRSAPISMQPPPHQPTYLHPDVASSAASIHATYNALYPRRFSTLTDDSSLANAMIASSLASSRVPSPAKSLSLHPRTSQHSLLSRTPSPHKPAPLVPKMRQTLRPTASSSDDDNTYPSPAASDDPYAKHKRKRHINKHANKYREGDRKRWRDVVTERERDRYEGVWAANRGVLVAAGPDEVHALVARDVWARSRLPGHVLAEVWELVHGSAAGAAETAAAAAAALSKEEFVVGLWLVDQKLKGRKLPIRVSDSVWDSVRLLKGIRIKPVRDREGHIVGGRAR